jgi:hypothetical protein
VTEVAETLCKALATFIQGVCGGSVTMSAVITACRPSHTALFCPFNLLEPRAIDLPAHCPEIKAYGAAEGEDVDLYDVHLDIDEPIQPRPTATKRSTAEASRRSNRHRSRPRHEYANASDDDGM